MQLCLLPAGAVAGAAKSFEAAQSPAAAATAERVAGSLAGMYSARTVAEYNPTEGNRAVRCIAAADTPGAPAGTAAVALAIVAEWVGTARAPDFDRLADIATEAEQQSLSGLKTG